MANDNAVLKKVRANFYTQDDDKDSDTFLECWINMKGERQAAYASVDGVGYEDGSTNEVDLSPKENPMRRKDIPGSWFQVRIHPNGHDTWRFHCDVQLDFDDGSTYKQDFPQTTNLSQDVTQGNFNL